MHESLLHSSKSHTCSFAIPKSVTVPLTGFHPGGGKASPQTPQLPPPPPQKKRRKKRGEEREREREREWRERERVREREREGCSLREAILFVGGVRERERRNAICCTCRCHAHLPPLTKFLDETLPDAI